MKLDNLLRNFTKSQLVDLRDQLGLPVRKYGRQKLQNQIIESIWSEINSSELFPKVPEVTSSHVEQNDSKNHEVTVQKSGNISSSKGGLKDLPNHWVVRYITLIFSFIGFISVLAGIFAPDFIGHVFESTKRIEEDRYYNGLFNIFPNGWTLARCVLDNGQIEEVEYLTRGVEQEVVIDNIDYKTYSSCNHKARIDFDISGVINAYFGSNLRQARIETFVWLDRQRKLYVADGPSRKSYKDTLIMGLYLYEANPELLIFAVGYAPQSMFEYDLELWTEGKCRPVNIPMDSIRKAPPINLNDSAHLFKKNDSGGLLHRY